MIRNRDNTYLIIRYGNASSSSCLQSSFFFLLLLMLRGVLEVLLCNFLLLHYTLFQVRKSYRLDLPA